MTNRWYALIGVVCFGLVITTGVYLTGSKTPSYTSRAQAPPSAYTSLPPTVTSLSEVHSADGTKKLVLKEFVQSGSTRSAYTVTASDISGANRVITYQATLPQKTRLKLPANSWSPDNKFVFVIEQRDDGLTALVFQANGETFADGSRYIDVGSIFRTQFADRSLRDVTGWDDPALLHVMSYNADKTIGLSYWFPIWSKSFIQLAHR